MEGEFRENQKLWCVIHEFYPSYRDIAHILECKYVGVANGKVVVKSVDKAILLFRSEDVHSNLEDAQGHLIDLMVEQSGKLNTKLRELTKKVNSGWDSYLSLKKRTAALEEKYTRLARWAKSRMSGYSEES